MEPIKICVMAIVFLFYGIYVAKGLWMMSRGIRVNQLGRGAKSPRTRRIERALAAVTYAVALAQGMALAGVWPLLWQSKQVAWVGAVVAAVGVVFFGLAVWSMQDSWRAGIDADRQTRLVTTGAMRLSRNPAFVGFDLFYVGMALAMPSWIMWGLTLVGVLLFHLQIVEEEKFLSDRFGVEYHRYSSKVRRYI